MPCDDGRSVAIDRLLQIKVGALCKTARALHREDAGVELIPPWWAERRIWPRGPVNQSAPSQNDPDTVTGATSANTPLSE